MMALKKQNKMLFIMVKCLCSRHGLKKIKKIRNKAYKKHDYSSSNRSISDSDFFLSSDSE